MFPIVKQTIDNSTLSSQGADPRKGHAVFLPQRT